MRTAEKQVLDVVKMDIHLDYTADGKRYIARISEIIPLEEGVPYPEYDPNNPEDSMANITREYYTRKTDRQGFVTNIIMHYDLDTHTYIADNRMSKELEERLRNNLAEDLRADFDKFMLEEWGPRTEDGEIIPAEEIERQLEELDAKTAEIKAKREAEMSKEENISAQIEADNQARAQWKQGYINQEKAQAAAAFSIGSFFDDSDYN